MHTSTSLRKVSKVPLASITKIEIGHINKTPTIKASDQYHWNIFYTEGDAIRKVRFLSISLAHVEDLIKQTKTVNPKVEVSTYFIR